MVKMMYKFNLDRVLKCKPETSQRVWDNFTRFLTRKGLTMTMSDDIYNPHQLCVSEETFLKLISEFLNDGVKVPISNSKRVWLRKHGVKLGYPECCMEYFIDNFGQMASGYREKNPLQGTGYIPCPSCINKPVKELIKTINQNRCETLVPFPLYKSFEQFKDSDIPIYKLIENLDLIIKLDMFRYKNGKSPTLED